MAGRVRVMADLVPVLDLGPLDRGSEVCRRLVSGCAGLGMEAARVDGCLGELASMCANSRNRMAVLNVQLMRCRMVRDQIDGMLPEIRRRTMGIGADAVPTEEFFAGSFPARVEGR